MKLGFLATKTIEGAGKGRPINDGVWRQYAVDIRSMIDGLNDFVGTGKDVVLLRFLGKEGFLVGIVITEVGRPRDNTTIWIHVPAEMKISGRDLEDTINGVKDEIRKKLMGLDDIRESCRRLFEEDYCQKNVGVTAVGRVRSKGIGIAAGAQGKSDDGTASAQERMEVAGLYYGEGEDFLLHELLGDYVAQPEYGNWAGIFLIDRKSGIKVRNALPSSLLKKTVVFSLPQPENGFNASYKNSELQGSIEFFEGEKIDIIWRKRGYQDIPKTIRIKKLDVENQRQTNISPNEIKYGVKRLWFRVLDEDGADISKSCSIKVNATELCPGNETTYINEDKGYRVVICCPGYKTMRGEEAYSEEFSSFNQIPPVRFKANRLVGEYTLSPDEADGLKYEAKVRIETKYPDDPSKKIPLRGYEVDEKKNMVYNDLTSAWARIKWFLIGFLVMAAIWGFSAGTKWFRGHYTFTTHKPFIERIDKSDSNNGKGKNSGGGANQNGDGRKQGGSNSGENVDPDESTGGNGDNGTGSDHGIGNDDAVGEGQQKEE